MPARKRSSRRGRRDALPGWGAVAAGLSGLVMVGLLLLRRLLRRRQERAGRDRQYPSRPAATPARAARPARVRPPARPAVISAVATHAPAHEGEVEPERRDVSARGVLAFGLVLLAFLGLILAAVAGLQILVTGYWPSFQPAESGQAVNPAASLPPPPRPEAIPGQTLQSVRATEAALLNTYEWIDRDAGIVRLPIDRAMDLIVRRGLPVQPGAESASYADQGDELPLDSSSGRVLEQDVP